MSDSEWREGSVRDDDRGGALVEVVFRRPALPRYERAHEAVATPQESGALIPAEEIEARIAASPLSPGKTAGRPSRSSPRSSPLVPGDNDEAAIRAAISSAGMSAPDSRGVASASRARS